VATTKAAASIERQLAKHRRVQRRIAASLLTRADPSHAGGAPSSPAGGLSGLSIAVSVLSSDEPCSTVIAGNQLSTS
jgi:hypothetical protein